MPHLNWNKRKWIGWQQQNPIAVESRYFPRESGHCVTHQTISECKVNEITFDCYARKNQKIKNQKKNQKQKKE
jgi:hypothetical protein